MSIAYLVSFVRRAARNRISDTKLRNAWWGRCGTTSGCVRATVVDAFSYNFPVLLVEDAVFDRGELSHAVNLFDMDQKYANVISSKQALDYVAGLRSGVAGAPAQ